MMDISTIIESDTHFEGDTSASITTQGGGAAANVATWLAYLGEDAYLVSRLGDDAHGVALQKEFEHYGVRHSGIRHPDEKTGIVVILVSPNGERTMFPDSGSNSKLSASDLPLLDGFAAAYISGYPLINPVSRANVLAIIDQLKAAGITLIIDPGTVGALQKIAFTTMYEWLALFDVVILNESEALFISQRPELEEALTFLATVSPVVVVKRGAQGSVAIDEKNAITYLPAERVDALDTTGAGDAFTAGFISEWLRSKEISSAMKVGSDNGRLCIQSVGARPPVPAIGKGK
jgi:sugar/nucleoside kinase (ribokinase family)